MREMIGNVVHYVLPSGKNRGRCRPALVLDVRAADEGGPFLAALHVHLLPEDQGAGGLQILSRGEGGRRDVFAELVRDVAEQSWTGEEESAGGTFHAYCSDRVPPAVAGDALTGGGADEQERELDIPGGKPADEAPTMGAATETAAAAAEAAPSAETAGTAAPESPTT